MITMDEDVFWKLIDDSRRSGGRQGEHLSTALKALTPEQIRGFKLRFMELMNRAYRWDIWGAAYWLNGGCSDDTFMDFRGNLIALGRYQFEEVLADADKLADIESKGLFAEGFIYIPARVFKEMTGTQMDFKDIRKEPGYPAHPSKPQGDNWDFDDRNEIANRLPRLFKKLPEGGS